MKRLIHILLLLLAGAGYAQPFGPPVTQFVQKGTNAQRLALSNPPNGVLWSVFDTDKLWLYSGSWIDITGGASMGDVTGPASSTDSVAAMFDGTTGKLLKDGAITEGRVAANDAKLTNVMHTGQVTGATALTITAGTVTNANLANVPTDTFKGRTTAGTGVTENMTVVQSRAVLNVADGADVTGSNAPQAHTTSHTDGTDNIQDATAAQKGVMTTVYAGRLDDLETTDNAAFGGLTIDTSVLFVDAANKYIGMGTVATNTDNQLVLEMTATKDILIDGSTNPRELDTGILRFEVKPNGANSRAITVNLDVNSQPASHGQVINITATGLEAGENASAFDVNVDRSTSTGGIIRGFEMSVAGVGSAVAHMLHADPDVVPMSQFSGSFGAVEQAWGEDGTFPDVTTAFNSAGTDVEIFPANADNIHIGMAVAFNEIRVNLAITASGPGIKPTFEYSSGGGTPVWTVFTPADETAGFRQSGVIDWDIADLTTPIWAVSTINGVSKFWIRITRTQGSLSTPPTEDTIQVSAANLYSWDENGTVSIANLVEDEGTVASGASIDIWVVNAGTLHVTGTTNITTSLGTAPKAGAWKKLIFDGILVLSDVANINLPGGANITTAADDFAYVYAETTTLLKVLYFKADGTPVVSAGGDPSINVETLAANKTIADGDPRYQYLDVNGAHREVTLPPNPTISSLFVIKYTGTEASNYQLLVKDVATTVDWLYGEQIKTFIWNGSNWVGADQGSGDSGAVNNVALGRFSWAYNSGTAVGASAYAYNRGAGVGKGSRGQDDGAAFGVDAQGNTFGVGVGGRANGATYGIAVGYQADTNAHRYATALGTNSECERYGEFSISIDNANTTKQMYGFVAWAGTVTAIATPAMTEIFLNNLASNRMTVLASSAFRYTLEIVAQDSNLNAASYTAKGLIERDAADNTNLAWDGTVTTEFEDIAGWDVQITADDTNESLKIEVLSNDSDSANFSVKWSVKGEIIEVRQ